MLLAAVLVESTYGGHSDVEKASAIGELFERATAHVPNAMSRRELLQLLGDSTGGVRLP